MQSFGEADREVLGTAHVWYYQGKEIEAFHSARAAEWSIRRALRISGSDDYLLDKDGRFLLLGLETGHTVRAENRGLKGI